MAGDPLILEGYLEKRLDSGQRPLFNRTRLVSASKLMRTRGWPTRRKIASGTREEMIAGRRCCTAASV